MTDQTAPADEKRVVTAALLIIGNEILSGRTHDANLPYVAEKLGARGIRLAEARVVADDEAEIVAAVNALRARYDHLFTTGGIGPTHDDITAQCVAKAFGVAIERNAEAVALLERHYPPGQLNEARLRMATIPAGATLIDNPVSKAPGFRMGNVFVMAGVPKIMQAMLDGLLPGLTGGPPVLSRSIAASVAEGTLAGPLAEIQARHPAVEIGSYPYFRAGAFGVSIVLRGTDPAPLDAAAAEVAAAMRALGAEPIE
ncbi:MAG: competence/damage-inducible protein A [Inquilinus sp.]|nr:competence/damage-inducible protein A [Inquilinus sp.]